jgi:ABC-type multidrug transport system ATPase subunit
MGRSFFEKEVWGKRAGMVFQHADEALDLKSTVYETFFGLVKGKIPSRDEILNYLSLLFDKPISTAFLNKKVQYLSGGQKQRLNLLRSFYAQPKLLILDEPLNGLDFESIRKVLNLLTRKQQEGCGLLLISHNEEIFDKAISPDQVYHLK